MSVWLICRRTLPAPDSWSLMKSVCWADNSWARLTVAAAKQKQSQMCWTAAWVACLVRWWVTRHKSKRSMINNATIEPRTKKQFVAAALRMCNFPTAAWMCMRNSTQWSSFQKCTGCSSTRKPTHQKSKSSTTRARAFCAFCMRCAMLLSLMTITFGCAG